MELLIGIVIGSVATVLFPKVYSWVKEKVDSAKSKL